MGAAWAIAVAGLLFSIIPAGAAGTASGGDAVDTATLYLQAWSYKDYTTMRHLSAPSTRAALSESGYYSAAARITAPSGLPKIAARRTDSGGKGEVIYFEYTDPGSTETHRGSVIITPEGVIHPELLGARGADTGSGADANPVSGSKTEFVGETAASIMQKMQTAAEAVKTMQGGVDISGSMMGTRVNETARLVYKAPDKIRLESKSFIMNSDGRRSILYMPEPNVYLGLDGLGELELTPGIGMSAEEMREKYEVQLVEKGEINGQPAFKLLLKSPTQSGGLLGGLGQGSGRMTLWVHAKSWLPMRATVDGVKIEYRDLQVNAGEINDAAFEFKPPPGSTSFSLGSLMGALSGGAGQMLPGMAP